MTRVDDAMILPLLERIRDCVCKTLKDRGLAADCRCILAPGSAFPPSVPMAGKGIAWVGVESIVPLDGSSCADSLTTTLNIGVLRCMPVTREDPTPEQYEDHFAQQMADMQALRKAIMCCDHEVEDVGLVQWLPYGPQGGVYGGSWQVTVG